MSLDEWVNFSIRYIPPGKLVDYLTGKLRKDTPEEHVRQRVTRSLVEEYEYEKDQIELDFRIYIGSKSYPVDIAIFSEDKPHKQESIYMIIETKNETVKSTNSDQGIGQLNSYMGASLNCKFGMWTNGIDKFCFQKTEVEGRFEISEKDDIVDIPPKGKSLDDYEKLVFTQLKPATELATVFRRCHNYIHGNQGIPKDMAFHELLKVIFCKVHDERESTKVRFYVTNKELKSSIGQMKVKERLKELFSEVKVRYFHIFKEDEKIDLHNGVLAYMVGQLQHFSLILTDTDVKGDAYEAIVGTNLKGDRGEFFTPRKVCKLAVESLFQMYPPEKWHNLRVIDPACGTGGFIVEIINVMKQHFLEEEKKKWPGDETQALKQVQERLRGYCEQFVYGIDINPLLVRTTQMNEVMHGNGSGNLFTENSLAQPGEWKEETRNRLQLESFEFVFTNPPFGSKIPIDDPHTLEQYDLAYYWTEKDGEFIRTEKLQKSVPPEELFIERCLQLLKPKGKLAIVLPDSILNNPSLAYIRYWLLRKTKIIASIDLPRETFQPDVGTKTSVLILEKKTIEDIVHEQQSGQILPYDVFMAIAENVGHDKRGKPVYRRTPEGEVLVANVEKEIVGLVGKEPFKGKTKVSVPVENDDLPVIMNAFRDWIKQKIA
jgi:type I restriction enzyme M protein